MRKKRGVEQTGDAYDRTKITKRLRSSIKKTQLKKFFDGPARHFSASVAAGMTVLSVKRGNQTKPFAFPEWLAAEERSKRFDLPDTVAGRRRMVERLDRRAVGIGAARTSPDSAGMDRRKAVDAQRGEREPATPPVQSSEDASQAAS